MTELSCYTTALVTYLDAVDPTARAAERLAAATRLAMRGNAFSHHTRIDGGRLSYRDSPDWSEVSGALRDELAAAGAVIAVGNTRHLPWSPQYGRHSVPHWIVVRGFRDGGWEVADDFTALTPFGAQGPFRGRLTSDQLRAAMTPFVNLPEHVVNRDVHALGSPVPIGRTHHYRWLQRGAPTGTEKERVTDTPTLLTALALWFCGDPAVLWRHTDDLWAAARHHCLRTRWLAAQGKLSEAGTERLLAAWSQLPRALRFAADSAARGRARPGVVERAFDQLIGAVTQLGAAA